MYIECKHAHGFSSVLLWIFKCQCQVSECVFFLFCLFVFCPNTCVLGMLLELPVPVITRILQDEAVLTAAVDKAFGALQVAQESRFCNTHLLSRLMSLSQHH